MAFLAGGYTATWNSLALGQTAEGHRLSHQIFGQPIKGDTYGQTVQDEVMQGAEMFVEFTLIEANAAAVETMKWPLSATKWTIGSMGYTAVGSSLAKSLVLTAVAGTPGAAAPASITCAKSMLATGYPVQILYGPSLRDIPIRLRVYPNAGVFAVET